MALTARETEFKRSFIDRTRLARELSGYTQEQVADALGIDQGRYKNYEVRTMLPHTFIPRFCMFVRVSEIWLFTGKDRPAPAPIPPLRRRGTARQLAENSR